MDPVVTETDAGNVVVVSTAADAAPTQEDNWTRFWTALEEMRNLQRSQAEIQTGQTLMLERLVESQQATITALSGQVSDGTAQVVAALATLTPQQTPVEIPQPPSEGLPTASQESDPPEEQNPEELEPARETPRRRRFL